MLATDDFYNDMNPQLENDDNCMVGEILTSYELDNKHVVISRGGSDSGNVNNKYKDNTEAYLYSQETLYDSTTAATTTPSIYNQLQLHRKNSILPNHELPSKCPCFQQPQHQAIYQDKIFQDVACRQIELKLNQKVDIVPPNKTTTFKINSPTIKQNSAFDFFKHKISTNVN